MLCDPLAHLLGDGLDGAVVERHLQAGGLAQLGVAGRAGTADEAQIALPCILLVMEAQQEELQSGHGGQAVVDIVEGALVDVELTLPASSAVPARPADVYKRQAVVRAKHLAVYLGGFYLVRNAVRDDEVVAVSYTHLDVYKRQPVRRSRG